MIETTFAIIKPDAVAAGHVGEIINVIERQADVAKRHEITIRAMRMHRIGLVEAGKLYVEHYSKHFYDDLIKFMISEPSVLMKLEGDRVIERWRTLMGPANSAKAGHGTLRSRFGSFDPTTMYRNAVHGSDSPEAARRELELFFPAL